MNATFKLKTGSTLKVGPCNVDAFKITETDKGNYVQIMFSNTQTHQSYVLESNTSFTWSSEGEDWDVLDLFDGSGFLAFNRNNVRLIEETNDCIWLTLNCGEKIKCLKGE